MGCMYIYIIIYTLMFAVKTCIILLSKWVLRRVIRWLPYLLISRLAGNLAYLLSGISHKVGLWPVKKMVRLMVILIFESWTDISSTMRLWPTNIDIWSPICGDVFCCCKELHLVCLVKIALQGIYIYIYKSIAYGTAGRKECHVWLERKIHQRYWIMNSTTARFEIFCSHFGSSGLAQSSSWRSCLPAGTCELARPHGSDARLRWQDKSFLHLQPF